MIQNVRNRSGDRVYGATPRQLQRFREQPELWREFRDEFGFLPDWFTPPAAPAHHLRKLADNPRLLDDFEGMYGYRPEKAAELSKEIREQTDLRVTKSNRERRMRKIDISDERLKSYYGFVDMPGSGQGSPHFKPLTDGTVYSAREIAWEKEKRKKDLRSAIIDKEDEKKEIARRTKSHQYWAEVEKQEAKTFSIDPDTGLPMTSAGRELDPVWDTIAEEYVDKVGPAEAQDSAGHVFLEHAKLGTVRLASSFQGMKASWQMPERAARLEASAQREGTPVEDSMALEIMAYQAGMSPKKYLEELQAEYDASGAPESRASYDRISNYIELYRPKTREGSAKWFLGAITEAVVTMVPAVTAGILTANPALGMALMSTQVYGDQYGQSIKEGRTHSQAVMDAFIIGAAEGLSEGIPLGILTRRGGKMFARIAKAGSSESLQEAFNEGLQIAYEFNVIKPEEEISFGKALLRMFYAGIIGGAVGTVYGGMHAGMFEIADKLERKIDKSQRRMYEAGKNLSSVMARAGDPKQSVSSKEVTAAKEEYLAAKTELAATVKDYLSRHKQTTKEKETAKVATAEKEKKQKELTALRKKALDARDTTGPVTEVDRAILDAMVAVRDANATKDQKRLVLDSGLGVTLSTGTVALLPAGRREIKSIEKRSALAAALTVAKEADEVEKASTVESRRLEQQARIREKQKAKEVERETRKTGLSPQARLKGLELVHAAQERPDTIGEEETEYTAAEGVTKPVQGETQVHVAEDQIKRFSETTLDVVGSFRTGFDVIDTPEKAAHVVAPIRKKTVENLVTVVLDKNQKPIAVLQHQIGDKTGIPLNVTEIPQYGEVEWTSILGPVHRIKGAASFWMGHNHPSGSAKMSNADLNINQKLNVIARELGVDYNGFFAVAFGGKVSSVFSEDNIAGPIEKIAPAARAKGKKVPVVGGRIIKVTDEPEITNPATAKLALSRISGGKSGVLLVTNKQAPVGWIPMTQEEMGRLRTGKKGTGASKLLQEIEATNAVAAVVYDAEAKNIPLDVSEPMPPNASTVWVDSKRYMRPLLSEAQNVGSFVKQIGMRMLDIQYGPDYISATEVALPITTGMTFLSKELDDGTKAAVAKPIFAPRVQIVKPGETLKPVPPGAKRFRHFGQAEYTTLDPEKMGTGLSGAEANRNPTVKVIAAYPRKGFVKEEGLGDVEYVIDVPKNKIYNANTDPDGLKAKAQRPVAQELQDGKLVTVDTTLDFSAYEERIKEAGYVGYETPNAQGNLKGQARFFESLIVGEVQKAKSKTPVNLEIPKNVIDISTLFKPQEKEASTDRNRMQNFLKEWEDYLGSASRIDPAVPWNANEEADLGETPFVSPATTTFIATIAVPSLPGPQAGLPRPFHERRFAKLLQLADEHRITLHIEPAAPAGVDTTVDPHFSAMMAFKEHLRENGFSLEAAGHMVRRSKRPSQTRYSKRPTNAGMGLSADVLNGIARDWRQLIGVDVPINVVQAAEDISAADRFRMGLVTPEIMSSTEGFYDEVTGEITLIANNIVSQERAAKVIAHEIVGHWGVRGFLGQHIESTMRAIYHAFRNDPMMKKIVKAYGLGTLGEFERMMAAEEFIAHLAGDLLSGKALSVKKQGFMDKVINAVRLALIRMGLFDPTREDVLSLIYTAHNFVKNNGLNTMKAAAIRRSNNAPWNYSQLYRGLNDMPGSASPKQWISHIKAAARKGKVKQTEVEWSGIIEWLEDLTYGGLALKYQDELPEGITVGDFGVTMPDQTLLKNLAIADLPENTSIQAEQLHKLLKSVPKTLTREAIQDYIQRNGVHVAMEDPVGEPEEIAITHGEPVYEEPDWNYLREEAELMLDNTEPGTDTLIDEIMDSHNEGLEKEHEDWMDKTDETERTTIRDDLIQERAEADWGIKEREGDIRSTMESTDQFDNEYEFSLNEEGYVDGVVVNDGPLEMRNSMDLTDAEQMAIEYADHTESERTELKHESYVTPGVDQEYHESLLTLNTDKSLFQTDHWEGSDNVLAHVRWATRKDPRTGHKTLVVDELQSDWHQQGREHGYKGRKSKGDKHKAEVLEKRAKDTLREWAGSLQAIKDNLRKISDEDLSKFVIMDAEQQAKIDKLAQDKAIDLAEADATSVINTETAKGRTTEDYKPPTAREIGNQFGVAYHDVFNALKLSPMPGNLRDTTARNQIFLTGVEDAKISDESVPTVYGRERWEAYLDTLPVEANVELDIELNQAGAALTGVNRVLAELSDHPPIRSSIGDVKAGQLRIIASDAQLAYTDARTALVTQESGGVQWAPFEKTWPVLMMKYIWRMAIDEGVDEVHILSGSFHGVRWHATDVLPEGSELLMRTMTIEEVVEQVRNPEGLKLEDRVKKGQKRASDIEADRVAQANLHQTVVATTEERAGIVPDIFGEEMTATELGLIKERTEFILQDIDSDLGNFSSALREEVARRLEKKYKPGTRFYRVKALEKDLTAAQARSSRGAVERTLPGELTRRALEQAPPMFRKTASPIMTNQDMQKFLGREGAELVHGMHQAGLEFPSGPREIVSATQPLRPTIGWQQSPSDPQQATYTAQIPKGVNVLWERDGRGMAAGFGSSVHSGVIGFYDVQMPNLVNKFLKKYKTKLVPGTFPMAIISEAEYQTQLDNAGRYREGAESVVPLTETLDTSFVSSTKGVKETSEISQEKQYLRVGHGLTMKMTPELKAAAEEGFPLFSINIEEDSAEYKSFKSKIGEPAVSLKDRWNAVTDRWQDRLRVEIFDMFHGIKSAEDALGIAPENQGYISARLSTGADAVIRAVLEFGTPFWDDGAPNVDTATGGFLDVFEPLKNDKKRLDMWLNWMVATRANRLLKEGRENLFTQKEVDAVLKEVEENGQLDEFQEIAKNYAAFKAKILDFAEEAGVIDSETRPMWEHADHIPFYRAMEEAGQGGPFVGRGIGRVSKTIFQLKGGKENLRDPFGNIMQNMRILIEASIRNHAMTQIVDNLEDSGIITKAPQIELKPALVPGEQLEKLLKDSGVDMDNVPEEALRGFRSVLAAQVPRGENVVWVQREGKRKYYYVHDPLVLKGLESMNPNAWSTLMSILRVPKRFFTASIVLSPGFMLNNWFRDMWHAFVLGRHKTIRPFYDSVRGWVSSVSNSPTFINMMSGAGTFESGFMNTHDPVAIRKIVRGRISASGVQRNILDTPRKLYEFYRQLANGAENAHRIAIFEMALKAGASRKMALYESRDIMDFSMRGTNGIMRFLVESVPFFGARVAGLYRTGRGLAGGPGENPKAVWIRGMMIAVASIAWYLFQRDDERYKDLNDYDKNMYYHFFDVFEKDDHYRLPKPFEIGAMFSTIPEIGLEAMLSDEPDKGKAAAYALYHVLTQMLDLSPQIQAVRPIAELMVNRNFFTDAPILSDYEKGKLPADQDAYWVSPSIRALALSMPDWAPNAFRSPKQLQHLIRGYVGTLAEYVLLATDVAARSAMDEPFPPTRRLDEMPFFKRWSRDVPPKYTKHMDTMYKVMEEASTVWNSMQAAKKSRDSDRYKELIEKHGPLLMARRRMGLGYKRVREINKRIRLIHLHPNLSPPEKRKMIDELMKQRNKIAKKIWDFRPGGKKNLPKPEEFEELSRREQVKSLREQELTSTASLLASMPDKMSTGTDRLLKELGAGS